MAKDDVKCKKCGWVGPAANLPRYTYREDFGDVDTVKCPECGAVVWEGMEFHDVFERVEGEVV